MESTDSNSSLKDRSFFKEISPVYKLPSIPSFLMPSSEATKADSRAIASVMGRTAFKSLLGGSNGMSKKLLEPKVHGYSASNRRLVWLLYGLFFDPARLASLDSLATYGRTRKSTISSSGIDRFPPKELRQHILDLVKG